MKNQHRNELTLGFVIALAFIVVVFILVTSIEVHSEERDFTRLEEKDRVGFDKIDKIADVVIWNHVTALKYATAADRAKQVEQTRREEAAPEPEVIQRPQSSSAPAVGYGVWDQLAQCESGGNWSIATGNGFYGGLQFTLQSWQAVGGTGMPNQASREEQISRGQALQAIQGWGAWPGCSAKLGLR